MSNDEDQDEAGRDFWLNPNHKKISAIPWEEETYHRYDLNEYELGNKIFDLMTRNAIDDEGLEFLTVIFRSLAGRNPLFRLKVERPANGGRVRMAVNVAKAPAMYAMVDKIDIQVAGGLKQESAIEQAMQENLLSRREVFRQVERIRKHRLVIRDSAADLGYPLTKFDRPDGYEIDDSGKLVPNSSASRTS
jgi:hypothetical protein